MFFTQSFNLKQVCDLGEGSIALEVTNKARGGHEG